MIIRDQKLSVITMRTTIGGVHRPSLKKERMLIKGRLMKKSSDLTLVQFHGQKPLRGEKSQNLC